MVLCGEGSWLGTVDASGAPGAAVPASCSATEPGTWSDSLAPSAES